MSDKPAYLNYWGKADPSYPGEPKWHPLVYHCLDVSAAAAAWWESNRIVRRAFLEMFRSSGLKSDRLRAWMLFFIALHDIGKCDARFQIKASALQQAWPGLASAMASSEPVIDRCHTPNFDHGHWGYSWAVRECPLWICTDDSYAVQDTWRPWLSAVTGHHGEFPQSADVGIEYAEEWVMLHDRNSRQELAQAFAELFLLQAGLSLENFPPDCERAAQALLAGFCSVCDWVGSNTEVMSYAPFDFSCSLGSYFKQRAGQILENDWFNRFGLLKKVGGYNGLKSLLNPDESPRGVQVQIDDLPLAPGLTLIEAPTGSGKTEAAFAYAWRLLEAGEAESIVFALPTQATANAMLKRTESFASKAYPKGGASVVLAHGKRELNPEFEQLVIAGRHNTAQAREEATAQCAAWLAQSRKRVFLGQVGVCTVDQVLLSVLPVRHCFVRGFGVSKSVLIVDEVHAYDSYMHGLLAEVLRRQKCAGGRAILLSATLPAAVRNRLFGAWGVETPANAAYPLIWQVTVGSIQSIEVPPDQQPQKREIFMECLRHPDGVPDDTLLDRVVAAAEAGARVAVVVNLVDMAQHLARRLSERTKLPVDLFHARFRFLDRQEKEKDTLNHFGREALREKGRIIVATQVVEQSLDLDFDWMVTQICPIDLLFQRLGRLHRHTRARPAGFESPCCTVVTVEGEDFGLHGLIYDNARVLWRTEQLLSGTDRIFFPQAYREWINSVYEDEEWKDEPETITKAHCEALGKRYAAEWEAKQMINTQRKPFGDDDFRIIVKTRDGEMSLAVLPVLTDGRFLGGETPESMDYRERAVALDLNTVPVPHSWKSCLAGIGLDEDGRYRLQFIPTGPDTWTAEVGFTVFKYTIDFGLERRKRNGSSH